MSDEMSEFWDLIRSKKNRTVAKVKKGDSLCTMCHPRMHESMGRDIPYDEVGLCVVHEPEYEKRREKFDKYREEFYLDMEKCLPERHVKRPQQVNWPGTVKESFVNDNETLH